MANILATKAPGEVKSALNDYADLLDMYASDQLAMAARYTTAKEKRAAQIRAEVYNSLAIELRETIVEGN